MNLLPVIERELICEARNTANYWLRLASAAALMGLGVLYLLRGGGVSRHQGAMLFHEMTLTIQLTLFVLVPMMASDCVSREKREGTLGLLFLTPLRAREIVLGKSLTHALRASTLLVATMPVLCIPLMMGGIDLRATFHAIATVISALAIALAVSIHASVRNSEPAFAIGHGLVLSLLFSLPFWTCLSVPLISGFSAFVFLPVSLVAAYTSIHHSSTYLAVNWRRELGAQLRPRWVEWFANSAFWRSAFRWNREKALDENPIAWLQEYSWQKRLAKWAWFFAMFTAAPAGGCIVGRFMDYTTWLSALTLALAAGTAFTATNTFRSDVDSLELLLVTPLSPRQILHGRLRGVFAHFFPALLILLFYWMVPNFFVGSVQYRHWMQLTLGLSTLVTIPVVGFWFALKDVHLVASWLISILVGYVAPIAVVSVVMEIGSGRIIPMQVATGLFVGIQIALAARFYVKLRVTLRDRTFLRESNC